MQQAIEKFKTGKIRTEMQKIQKTKVSSIYNIDFLLYENRDSGFN
jgi:hypothetical protein